MRYNNLHAGRFLAAVTVLAFHLVCHAHATLGLDPLLMRPIPAALFTLSGVYLFVLSGFVLTHVLQTSSLKEFVGLRLLRIFPVYWAVAGTVLLVRYSVGAQIPFDNRGLVHAFFLWPAGPNRSAFSLGVEWTLVYEVLLSLSLVPLAACGRRWGIGVGAAVWLALIVGKMVLNGGREFLPFPRASEFPLSVVNGSFLLGVLAYLSKDRLRRIRVLLPIVAAAGVAAGVAVVTKAQGLSYFLQSVGIAAVVSHLAGGSQLRTTHPLVRAGDRTYGVYLLHVPVMLAALGLCARYSLPVAPLPATIVAGALALAAGSAFGAVEWAGYRRLRAYFKNPARPPAILPLPAPAAIASGAA